jgi:hypothetical protein
MGPGGPSGSGGGPGMPDSGGSSGQPAGPCTCPPGQSLAYPTNLSASCGSLSGLLCAGPSQGFTDDPPCGVADMLYSCTSGTALLPLACTLAATGMTAVQSCH